MAEPWAVCSNGNRIHFLIPVIDFQQAKCLETSVVFLFLSVSCWDGHTPGRGFLCSISSAMAGDGQSWWAFLPLPLEVFPRPRSLPWSRAGWRQVPATCQGDNCLLCMLWFNLLPLIAAKEKKIGLFGHLMKLPASSHFPAVLWPVHSKADENRHSLLLEHLWVMCPWHLHTDEPADVGVTSLQPC